MQEEGFERDEGRQSLTEVGATRTHAPARRACRRCGTTLAADTGICPKCGELQRTLGRGAADRIGSASRPRPRQAPRRVDDTSPLTATPARAGASRAAPSGQGERFVAWSAVGVLAIAAALVAERVDELRFAPVQALRVERETPRPTSAAPELRAAPIAPPAAPLAAPVEAPDTVLPAQGAVSAARQVAKPHTRSKPRHVPRPMLAAIPDAGPGAVVATVPAVAAMAPQELVARSRWDTMRDEIATCSPTDILDGAICRQRIRIRYCPGWWGQVEDCPSRHNGYGG